MRLSDPGRHICLIERLAGNFYPLSCRKVPALFLYMDRPHLPRICTAATRVMYQNSVNTWQTIRFCTVKSRICHAFTCMQFLIRDSKMTACDVALCPDVLCWDMFHGSAIGVK
jgi:hypothetical protein